MSHTRCPVCATMFRVVADQLKVAQGWVRCGQCGEVFDGWLQLVPGEAAERGALASTPDASYARPMPQPARQEAEEILINKLPLDKPPANARSERQSTKGLAFMAPAGGLEPSSLPASEALGLQPVEPEVRAVAAKESEAEPEVSFVREARRQAFWKSSLARALLGLICLALLAALGLQWMVRQKDVLAAQEPRLAPLLQALCRPLGCAIRPLRRIESVLIDSANLTQTGADIYRLIFVFKNTGAAALEIPAVEITLTDGQDQALVRRVVMPAQFGATATALDAHSELAGALSLKVLGDRLQGASSSTQAGSLPVAGYRILAFYP